MLRNLNFRVLRNDFNKIINNYGNRSVSVLAYDSVNNGGYKSLKYYYSNDSGDKFRKGYQLEKKMDHYKNRMDYNEMMMRNVNNNKMIIKNGYGKKNSDNYIGVNFDELEKKARLKGRVDNTNRNILTWGRTDEEAKKFYFNPKFLFPVGTLIIFMAVGYNYYRDLKAIEDGIDTKRKSIFITPERIQKTKDKKKEMAKRKLEKHFNEYATVLENENYYMNEADFITALGYKLKNETYDNGKKKIIGNFSTDDMLYRIFSRIAGENGLVGISEYVAFVRIFNGTLTDLQLLFQLADVNDSNSIKKEEFLEIIQKYTYGDRTLAESSKLFKKFFKNEREVNYKEFVQLMDEIEHLQLESSFLGLTKYDDLFNETIYLTQGDINKITIPTPTLLSYFRKRCHNGVIPKRIFSNLQKLLNEKRYINFEEFKALHDFVKHANEIEVLIRRQSGKSINKYDFIEQLEKEIGYKISETEKSIIFFLFVYNNVIDKNSLITVLNSLRNDLIIEEKQPQMKIHHSILIGGASAAVGATVVFPIDKTKTRIQSGKGGASILGTMKNIIKNEGPKRLYRGLQAQLIGITPEKALKLTANDLLRKQLQKSNKEGEQLTFVQEMLAGIGTGFIQVIVTNPIEIVKIRLQMQEKSSTISPTKVVKDLGIRGLYKGIGATLLRDIPFNAIYFSSYAAAKNIWKKHTNKTELNAFELLGASCIAGSLGAGLDTPADVIKTRLQNGANQYTGIRDCVKQTYASHGIQGFFKGVSARILIISPLFGITMMCYELLQRLFFPKTKTGIALVDSDFTQLRKSRLRNLETKLYTRFEELNQQEEQEKNPDQQIEQEEENLKQEESK